MRKLFIIIFILFLSSLLFSQDKVVKLTSLEWPPYSSQQLNQQGASIVVAKAAFLAMGYQLEVDFYPWARAIELAKNNSNYDGYFPEYYDESITKNFYFSDSIGISPLGFAERKNKVINWSSLMSLKSYRIGTVRGYVNTKEFDDLVSNKMLNVDPATDDYTNLIKLANGRLDLAVIDKLVMDHLLATESELMKFKNELQFNQKILEEKKLFVCFKKNEQGQNLQKIFNEGLKKINVDAIVKDYISNLYKN